MPSLPAYAPIESRDGTITKGSFIKNGFVEKVGDAFHAFRRPGLAVHSTLAAAAAGRGIVSMKDYKSEEHLYAGLGGSLYSDGVLRTAGSWAEIAAPNITSGSHFMVWPTFIKFRGLLFAFGPGHTADAAVGSCTRFMAAYSGDSGATWSILINVADGTSGYPRGTVSYHATIFNGAIWLLNHQTGTYTHVWSTENGVNYTQVSAAHGMTGTIQRVVAHSDTKLKAFTISGTTNRVYESAAGTSWTQLTAAPAYNDTVAGRDQFGAVSFAGVLYVIGGTTGTLANNRRVYKSADHGTTWTQVGSEVLTGLVTADPSSNFAFMDGPVCWMFVQTDNNLAKNVLYYSTDFTTWTLFKTETTEVFQNNNVSNTTDGAALIGDYFVAGVINSSANADVVRLSAPLSGSAMISLATIAGNFFDFTQNYARTKVVFKSDVAAYELNVEYGVVTQVTDVDYPPSTVRGLAYLDGYFFVMDTDGNIFNSAAEDFTSWAAADYIAAEFEPDGGIALTKYNNYIVAFGEYSTEFFYNAGNATNSPLSPVQNGVMNVGCADGDTVISVGEAVLWLAQERGNGQGTTNARFIAMLQGTSYKRISSHDINRILEADDLADVDACCFSVGAHTYYHVRLGTSNLSLVYDLNQEVWYVWNRRRDSFTATHTGVVTASGTATWVGSHSFSDGDVGIVTAFAGTHTALNGTYNMIVPSSGTLCWNVGTAYSGTSSGTGTSTGYSEDDLGIVAACGYAGLQIMQDKSNGKLYKFTTATHQDGGVYMDWQIRFPKVDDETNERKFLAWADFISDRVSGNALLRYSDDDSQTWSKYRARSLSGDRTRWNRLGNMRRRVFDVRVTDNIAIRARRLEYSGEK